VLANDPRLMAIDSQTAPYVELSFGVIGKTLPADHGYGLYSAIAHLCPDIHEQEGISILTISGIPNKQGKIYLTEKSRFRMRVSTDHIASVYRLAGKSLKIGNHSIRLGVPQIFSLQAYSLMRSRIVVIKGFQEVDDFLQASKRQLDKLGITGSLEIPKNLYGLPDRKTIKIKRFTIVGFGLEVGDLSEEDSLKLQSFGLGGKRRMGCGVFVPGGDAV
jgi:CRISPR-associated protein Cas6